MNRRNFIFGGLGLLGTAAVSGTFMYTRRAEFGRVPSGLRLQRIMASPHYVDGKFQNLVPVEIMERREGSSRFKMMWDFLFGDKKGIVPDTAMVSKKTDLKALDRGEDIVIWMGHSTFYLQLGGYRILIDPVFSSYAAPLPFLNGAFSGSNVYCAEDIPKLDILAVSHDHWDHLDYPTVMALKHKINYVVCPLGVGEYFEEWGFSPDRICEEDWNGKIVTGPDLEIHILPSQHFSGRFLTRNPTLWCGMAFVTPRRKVYYTGDGGYGEHFKEIGKTFGGFDLVLAEDGQYNEAWHAIHMYPEETARAAVDVGAKQVIPAHGGKFALARHLWQEPYRRLAAASRGKSYDLVTPEIGETVRIGEPRESLSWWEDMT